MRERERKRSSKIEGERGERQKFLHFILFCRDNKIAYTQGVNQESGSRPNSTLPPGSPDLSQLPHRGPSPFLPGPSHFERALQLPVDTLPQTVFPQLNASGGYVAPSDVFSPKPTRDHQQDVAEEQALIINQVSGRERSLFFIGNCCSVMS